MAVRWARTMRFNSTDRAKQLSFFLLITSFDERNWLRLTTQTREAGLKVYDGQYLLTGYYAINWDHKGAPFVRNLASLDLGNLSKLHSWETSENSFADQMDNSENKRRIRIRGVGGSRAGLINGSSPRVGRKIDQMDYCFIHCLGFVLIEAICFGRAIKC